MFNIGIAFSMHTDSLYQNQKLWHIVIIWMKGDCETSNGPQHMQDCVQSKKSHNL